MALSGACSPCVLAVIFLRFLMLHCKRLSRLEGAQYLTDFRVLWFSTVNYTKLKELCCDEIILKIVYMYVCGFMPVFNAFYPG